MVHGMSSKKNQSQKLSSLQKQFWGYVLPTVGAMMVSGLYQLVDGIFIGRFIGADGLSGINLVWPALGALYGLGMLVGVGSGAISSMARGKEDSATARQSLGNGMGMILVIGLLGSLLLALIGNWTLHLQNGSGSTLAHAQEYLFIVILGAPLTLGSMALPFMVRNDQAPTVATLIITLGAILNIILNGLFIGYLGWGLTGAALGTILSQLAVVVLGVIYFFSDRATTKLTLKDLIPNWQLTQQTCTIGLSSLLMFFYFSFIMAVHNYLFMEYGDATIVGAFAIVGYIAALYYMFAEGVASGTQPLISYEFGAGNLARMKQFVRLMLLVSVGSGIISVALINLLADPIATVFNDSDSALYDATITGLRLHLIAMFLDGFIFSVGVFFQSLGMGRKATFVTMANMVVQLPFLVIMPRFFELNGVWLAVPVSNIALSVVALWMLMQEWRKLKSPTQGHTA